MEFGSFFQKKKKGHYYIILSIVVLQHESSGYTLPIQLNYFKDNICFLF